jgi:CPA2 family monovalent cation:H+ antiporter-2
VLPTALPVLASSEGTHAAELLIQLGGVLFVLGLLGRLARVAKLPVIPLYLLAGLAFGQGGLVSLKASESFIQVSAEIGVILLLVMLGLEYSASELLGNVRSQAPVGALDAVINALPGAGLALLAGWGPHAAVALAGITWVSSSGVIAKVLNDLGRLGNRETPAILGILVVEDLSMAIYLPLLTALVAGNGLGGIALAVTIALVTVFLVLFIATRYGGLVTKLVFSEDAESLLLATLGLTVLVAGIAQQLQVSSAVGAFLVGIALSGTAAETAVELLTPLRDLFAAAFFVFFGLSTEPHTLVGVLPLALALAVVGTGTKLTTGYVAAARQGIRRRGRWRAATALVPRGEFSVVVAALAVQGGAEPKLAPLTAAYVLLTIIIGAAIAKVPDRLSAVPARTRRKAERLAAAAGTG